MSAAEINDTRCPDCNAPTIWEQVDGAWRPMRCDECQRHHDMEEAGGPRSSAGEAEGRHDLRSASVRVVWGPDESYGCGWWWCEWDPADADRPVEPDWIGPFATSSDALDHAKKDADRPAYRLADARAARRVDLGNDPDGGLLLVSLDPVATRCLACLEAADLNPWSFTPSDFGSSADPELDPDAYSKGLANEDDQSLARSVFTGSGLMGGCYMPAVTYHHAKRIREFVTILQACFYEREAEWGCELPKPEQTDAASLDVWWCCMAIESVAYAIEATCEEDDQ